MLGAAGGPGSAAVVLGKALGATVIAAASSEEKLVLAVFASRSADTNGGSPVALWYGRYQRKGRPLKTSDASPETTHRSEPSVHHWRAEQLKRLGVPDAMAEIYADRVDWHEVARLVQRGCPPSLALRITR